MSVSPSTRAAVGIATVIAGLALAAVPPPAADASRRDIDRDGVPNRRDRDIDGDRIPNKRDRDIDGDRKKNGRDREMDADGILNSRDPDIDADRLRNCGGGRDKDMDADRLRNNRDRDMDADGRPNGRDRDIDADGVPNHRDRDMDCDGVHNRVDRDIDGDRIPNYRDADSDANGTYEHGRLPRRVRLPRTFFGLVAAHAFATEGRARSVQLDQIARTGVRTLRQTFEWSQVELRPGVYSDALYDSVVGDAARHGFTVLPVLFNPPGFRSSRPLVGAARGTYPPRSNGEFGHFAARMVRRYGPNGSFWREHPSIPRHPIRAWQAWNEPHLKQYWPSGPDPAAYTLMLKAVSGAIKSADPGAEVITAPLSETHIGMALPRFLRGMYRAGARGAFDTLAINPYAGAADQVCDILRRARRIANRNGDRRRAIRITELGWSTGGPVSPYRLSRTGQAELVKRVWAALVRRRRVLRLKGLVYFGWRDLDRYAPLYQDFFGLHTGLLERDGRSKPARRTFTRTVRAMIAR